MERHNSQSIGDVLRMAFQENDMQGHLDELRAINVWPQIIGPSLASQTRRPTVINGIMTVGIPNAALRNELLMSRSSLIRAINSWLGKEVIAEIRFTSH